MRKIILLVSLVLVSLLMVGCDSSAKENSINSDEYVYISLSDLSDKAQFYTYEYNGVKINYFAVLGSDREPRTAFDACDVCGGYKGYQQRGSDITCRNCGRVFRIDGLGTKNKGYGCWPSYLLHEIKGDTLLIKIKDIKNSIHRFA